MTRLQIVPVDWPCTLNQCPPGLFTFISPKAENKEPTLCLKTEYGDEAYIAASGEYFCGGAKAKEDIAKLIVQPARYEWIDEE